MSVPAVSEGDVTHAGAHNYIFFNNNNNKIYINKLIFVYI